MMNTRETRVLPALWKLPDAITRRFGDRPGKQRLMQAEGHILVILHKVPEPNVEQREAVFFWRNPEGEWKTTMAGSGMAALREHVRCYDQKIDQLEKTLTAASTAEDYFRVLAHGAPVNRAASHMHQVLQSLREAIPDDTRLISLRDDAYDVEREAALLMEEARHAMDFNIARRAELQAANSQQLAVAGHRLNLMAALFLPVTALASIFGMNLYSGLEESSRVFFWMVMALGLFAGLVLMTIINRRSSS